MAYWGKLIGAAAGLFMGGPVGALFGVVAGHSIDRARTAGSAGVRLPRDTLADVGFALMGHVAKADGRVSEAEIVAADAWMRRLQLDAGQRRRAMDHFNAGKQPGFSVADTVQRLRRQGRTDPRAMRLLLEMLVTVAVADGHLAPASRQALVGVLAQLGLPAALLEAVLGQAGVGSGGQRRRPAAPSLQQDYALLGVPAGAEPAVIKRAYRRLMSRHHPDKAGAGHDATERAQAINAAYQRIREARGF